MLQAAAAALLVPSCSSKKDEEEGPTRSTAIVIGTGFGGSIAAQRLAKAGVDTIVLERGRRWEIRADGDTFCNWEAPDGRSSWLSDRPVFPFAPPATTSFDKYVGVIDKLESDEIDVVMGAGVGGGSLVYGATMVQPAAEVFAKVFPPEVSYDELARIHYPRVKQMIGLSAIPDDILAAPNYTSSRLFLEAVRKTPLKVEINEAAVDWNIVREELAGKKRASLSIGQLVYGVNSGAKSSVDRNYLAEAERSGKVTVKPLHVVTKIAQEESSGPTKTYRVECNVIDEHGAVMQTRVFVADYLFLAAGSIGTSSLLVKAKATGTLPALNEHVGQGWSNNGDFLIGRKLDIPTKDILGAPPVVIVHDHANALGPITLEHGTGATGVECNCQPVLGMGIPKNTGSFMYDAAADSAVLKWSKSDMGTIIEATKATLNQINAAGGGTIFDLSALTGLSTYHPLGGAVLGKACDFYGRVKNYPRLYVVDGALCPGSTACANPSFTIAALAERCMDHILVEDFGKA